MVDSIDDDAERDAMRDEFTAFEEQCMNAIGTMQQQLAWLVELSPPADLHSRINELFRQMSSVNYQSE